MYVYIYLSARANYCMQPVSDIIHAALDLYCKQEEQEEEGNEKEEN